jgi:hypothetical protein
LFGQIRVKTAHDGRWQRRLDSDRKRRETVVVHATAKGVMMVTDEFLARIRRQRGKRRPGDVREPRDHPQCADPEIRDRLAGLWWLTEVAEPELHAAADALTQQRPGTGAVLSYAPNVPSLSIALDTLYGKSSRSAPLTWTIKVERGGDLCVDSSCSGPQPIKGRSIRSADAAFVRSVFAGLVKEFG